MVLSSDLCYKTPAGYGVVCLNTQGGTNGTDRLVGAALGDEGTVFLGGFTTGLWGDVYAGGIDFAGVLLNLNDGTELCRWQVFEPRRTRVC